MTLRQEIIELIKLHQEGPYWDFKKEWYKDDEDSDLLIDIICMANNLVNRDAYIIIGVDEENGFCINDVSNNVFRKNTQNLTDFIRSKKFAGEFRPIVTVETFKYRSGSVDVIVVHNSNNTPFFLRERYKSVNPINIYVRLQDSNTPINQSADYHTIEYLWKKRFGMLLDPIDKLKLYLTYHSDWEYNPSDDSIMYFKHSPEYTIEIICPPDDSRDGYEYYLFSQTDTEPKWADIIIRYHQTVLINEGGMYLDGYRAFTVSPDLSGFKLNDLSIRWDVFYSYMEKDSLTYLLHRFFIQANNTNQYAIRKFEECILIFKDHKEHEAFKKYAITNWKNKESFINEEILMPYFEEIPGYNMDAFKEEYRNVQILRIMLTCFRDREAENNL